MRLRMPSVNRTESYAGALALFERATERRFGAAGSGTHKLPGHNTDFTGMSKQGSDILFHYHRTVVVTCHEDNSATFDLSYRSQSTCEFAERFRCGRYWFGKEGQLVHTNGAYYRVGNIGIITLTGEGEIVDPASSTIPFERRRVDRKKANAAMAETGAHEFITWYKLMSNVIDAPEHQHTENGPIDMISDIKDSERWAQLLRSTYFGHGIHPREFLAKLRALIYEKYDCYYVEEHASAPTYSNAKNWR
jgi:hypothetical protein